MDVFYQSQNGSNDDHNARANSKLNSKIAYTANTTAHQPSHNQYALMQFQSNHHRFTSTKVLSSKALIEYILSYIPIQSLPSCSYVNHDWYLITKYIVPIPLINLKTLCMGELVYWLPGENQFPKTVLLKLKLLSGIPKFIQISTSIKPHPQHKSHKNGFSDNNSNTQIVGTSGHYQMLELSEILFIIDGHWTPIFEQLNQQTAQQSFAMDESQFFHRSKCFSIVTNTYMTYDFISFNPQTNKCIVNTLRSILYQTHELSSKMAIHAKANKRYYDGMNQTPLIFTNTLSALNFEMFVLILQDCIHKIGLELNIDIPSVITTQANASLLYPMIANENISFSQWYPWCKEHIMETLKMNGYIETNETEQDIQVKDEENDHTPDEGLYNRKKHNRRQSSLFGVKAFPMDETYDLFGAIVNSEDEDEAHFNDPTTPNIDSNDPNCCIM